MRSIKPQYTVSILSNITLHPLKEILEYNLRVHLIDADSIIGDYDNIVQDSIKHANSDLVIIFWEPANFIEGFHYKADLMSSAEIDGLVSKMKKEIDFIFHNLKSTPFVLFNKFSSILFSYNPLATSKFDAVCNEMNAYLENTAPDNVRLIDLSSIFCSISIDKCIDRRFFYSSKALYSIEFYKEYTSLITPVFLSIHSKTKKAIIFDCDNTLWGGILGEVGPDGIEMSSNSVNGTIFKEIQSLAAVLAGQGVIIGLCSKNNPRDIDEILSNHPDMIIRDKDIVIKKVNWNDKARNLVEIARELNIGIDSLVFVDDSDFEVDYVRKTLPEVTVLQVPKKIYDYPELLRKHFCLFYKPVSSNEDLKRTLMYQQEIQRKKTMESFSTIEDYLKTLELKVTIYLDEPDFLKRTSQLTQKTNQFNLTTRRYTESEILAFLKSPDYKIFLIGLSDKFGDYGITGLLISEMDFESKQANIDSFLLSCRIIGRKIESYFLDYFVDLMKKEGIRTIKACYIRTPKNEQVSDLYDLHGFDVLRKESDRTDYLLNISQYHCHHLDFIRSSDEGKD